MQYDNTPKYVLEKAKEQIAKAEARYEQAKRRIPEQYHDFLMLIEHNVKLFNKNMVSEKDEQARKLRIWGSEKGTYVTISLPYFTVDGRVQMARDEHRKKNQKLNILPPVISEDRKYLSVTVESELLGTATGTVMINVGGTGVDKTNPLENAETSAVGRALSFLGYGLVGTGIASAEEVENAKNAQNNNAQKQNSDNVVDFRKKESGNIKPNAQFVDMRAIPTKSGEACYEMIFKAGEREERVYAFGEMIDHIDQIAEHLSKNSPCYIETERKGKRLILHELEVAQSV